MALALNENNDGIIHTIDLIGHDEKMHHVIRSADSHNEIEMTRRELGTRQLIQNWQIV